MYKNTPFLSNTNTNESFFLYNSSTEPGENIGSFFDPSPVADNINVVMTRKGIQNWSQYWS